MRRSAIGVAMRGQNLHRFLRVLSQLLYDLLPESIRPDFQQTEYLPMMSQQFLRGFTLKPPLALAKHISSNAVIIPPSEIS